MLCLFLCNFSFAQDSTKVLFIGNSLTAFGSQPEKVKAFADEAGKNTIIMNGTQLGMSIEQHCSNAPTISLIYSQDWDYVVLQGADYSIAFPDYINDIYPAYICLDSMIKDNNDNTKTIFFMDWCTKYGVTFFGTYYDFFTFQDMIYWGTRQAADSLNMMIAPIGWAWKQSVAEHPEIDLFHPDNGHPSNKGGYLNACVYYSAIFQESVEDFEFIDVLPPAEAAYLQSLGSHIVLDSLYIWNIYPYTSEREYDMPGDIKLYPNPVNNMLIVGAGQKQMDQINIYDLRGVLLKSIKVSDKTAFIDVSCFPSEMYIIQVKNGKALNEGKFIKN